MPDSAHDLTPVPVPGSDDPPPLEPERPLPMDCCDSGCERCVSDIYADEMAHYRVLLEAWRSRNPGREPEGG